MKRILALAASLMLTACLIALPASAETPSGKSSSAGYKVYPFSLYTNPNSSVSLKMTPDGGYTLARNPEKSGDVANLSFLVSNDTEAVDYETMRYLYLNNLDTTAPIYAKAKFVSNIYPGGETWDGQLVYENGSNPPESNTTITIDLKEKMGAAWTPEGKILCLQFWVEHGDTDERMNLSSIWLGAEGADMTETAIRSAEPVDFSQATVAGGTTASDSAHPDGFVFNQTGTGANVTKEVDVSLSKTPYAYIHVTGYTTAGVAQLFNLYILPEGSYDAADGGVGLGSKPVNLRTDSLQGDSEYWLRLDLREYFSAAKQAKDPLGVVFSAQPTGDSATLKIGGMYVGGQTFTATHHLITLTVGTGGVVTGPETVRHGANAVYTVTPDEGYVLDSLTVNGEPVSLSGNTLTIENVTADSVIAAAFKDGRGDTTNTTAGETTATTSRTEENPTPTTPGEAENPATGQGAATAVVLLACLGAGGILLASRKRR